jgi:apolipoprotein N-acyltransferase
MAVTEVDRSQQRDPDAAASAPGASDKGRVVAGLLLALLTPVLVGLANPPFGVWPLIFVAFVPMVIAQHVVMPRRLSGLAIGIGIGGTWAVYFSWGLAGGDVALVYQLMPLYVAAIVTAIAWRSRRFHERTNYRWFLISFPLIWTALEFLRSTGSETLGGTWGYHAYALYRHPTLLQPISIFGITALQLLIFLANFALAGLVLVALHRIPRRRTVTGSVVIGALLLGWVVGGFAMMGTPKEGTVRVAAVQAGIYGNQDGKPEERLARDIEMTRAAAARGAKLVVWNEAGLAFDPQIERTAELRSLAAETNTYIAIGYRARTPDGRYRNEVTLLAPDGQFLGKYGKNHPGTFAGDYSDVKGVYPVFRTALGPISSIICYDLDYTDTARILTRNGARLIATSSADLTPIAQTHYTHLVFRSIENRVPTIKADNAFDSAIIDSSGRLQRLVVTPHEGRATIIADVALGSGHSPWVSFGEWFGWLTVVGMGVFLVLGGVVRWRARSSEAAASD